MTDVQGKPRDERWSSYPETVLIFGGDREVCVDLREPVSRATRDALQELGLEGEFSVLTAFNPQGLDLPAQENLRRMKELEAELGSAGDKFIRVDACSPDRSHCECSVALMGERKRAIDMATRWEQIAIFWWDGSTFWIYGAITEGNLRLPVQDSRTERH